MLSFPHCLLLLHILLETHSNLKHLSNPNQNENKPNWKFFKKTQTLQSYIQKGRKRDLVASVDINCSYPELKRALPRSEIGGQLFLNILEIQRRQHSAFFYSFCCEVCVCVNLFEFKLSDSNVILGLHFTLVWHKNSKRIHCMVWMRERGYPYNIIIYLWMRCDWLRNQNKYNILKINKNKNKNKNDQKVWRKSGIAWLVRLVCLVP